MDRAMDGDMERGRSMTDETGRHHLPYPTVLDRFVWNKKNVPKKAYANC